MKSLHKVGCYDGNFHLLQTQFVSGIVTSEGPLWREARKLAANSLRDFGVGKASIEGKVLMEADNIVDEIKKNIGRPYSFGLLFRKATSNVMSAMLFGKR